MKNKFYNPHTVITDTSNLDKMWLEQKIKDKPYDQHYNYLEALRLIGTGNKKAFIEKAGSLLFNSSNKIRISSLIDRATQSSKRTSNSMSTVEIKSKKALDKAKLSPLLVGLIPLVSDSEIEESESKDGPVSDLTASQSESSLILDEIDISEIDRNEGMSEPIAQTEVDNSTLIVSDDDEQEEEEYVSNRVQLQEQIQAESNPNSQSSDVEVQDKEVEVEAPIQSVSSEEKQLSASDSVQIQHSQFTSWLRGLPRLNEINQLPETEPKTPIISEPYAKILIQQGHKTDAIKMYEQLILKYPEKSSFFADQIKKLK